MTPTDNIRFRLEKFRKVYAELTLSLESVSSLSNISFDLISSLRERRSRMGGYIAALEFALEQFGFIV